MDTRVGEQGYIATELQPSGDVNTDFESFYNFSADSKKLTQLAAAPTSRFSADFPAFFSRDTRNQSEHAMDMRGLTTSVSVEESDFLEEFMACDFTPSSRDRSNLGSLTDLSFSGAGSLTELDNLPRSTSGGGGGEPALICNNSTNNTSSITSHQSPHHHHQQAGFKFSSYDQEQENRFPGTRRIHSSYASTSQQPVGSKSLKIMKQKGGNSNENSGGSLLRQQLQGSLCSNKYRKAQETLCKECGKPITAKCLLKNCRKSDEVLCPDCGRELTVKCLLKSCSN